MHNKKEVKKVLVASNCTRTVGLTPANLAINLGAGEIIVLDERGNIVNTAAKAKAASGIKLMQGITGGGVYMTDLIQKNKVNSFKGFKFRQSKEQRVALGYNGTSGSIDLVDDNSYSLIIEYDNTGSAIQNDFDFHKLVYKSPLSGTTQYMVAKALANQYAANIDYITNFNIKVNVISDATPGTGLGGCEVIEGSKAISYTTGTPVVGAVYSIPGKTGTPYRDELNGIYEAVSIDTVNNIVILDKEYQNMTQSGIAIGVIADTTTDDYGIVIEGKVNKFNVGFGDYVKTFTHIQRDNFGVTTFTDSGTGFEIDLGNGRHESVSIEEFYYQGNVRDAGIHREFAQYVKETKNGYGYSGITIDFYSNEKINLGESNGSSKNITIFTERGNYQDIEDSTAGTAYGTNIITGTGADTVDGDSFLNVLNAFMVGSGVITTGLNTVSNGGSSLAADGIFSAGVDL